jgi:hypothetical protein
VAQLTTSVIICDRVVKRRYGRVTTRVDAEASVGVLVHDHGYSDSREIPPQEQKRKCRHMRALFLHQFESQIFHLFIASPKLTQFSQLCFIFFIVWKLMMTTSMST